MGRRLRFTSGFMMNAPPDPKGYDGFGVSTKEMKYNKNPMSYMKDFSIFVTWVDAEEDAPVFVCGLSSAA